jgi:magnesium transporter
MMREQTLIPVDMDQEESRSLPEIRADLRRGGRRDGRLVGMITVDDIVHIIQEEAGEDALLLSGAGDGRHQRADLDSYRERVRWLAANLMTRLVASS